jgi:two-component system sensor histidine kinase UhpB
MIPTAILSLGLLATVGVILQDAQARIAAEITSGMQLGHELVSTALRNVANAGSPAAAFEQLAHDLPHVRHVQFQLIPNDPALFHFSQLQIGESPPRTRPWLARLLAPPPLEQVFPVVVRADAVGTVRLRSNSADEIAEIMNEVVLFSATLIGLGLLIAAGLLWTVQRALHPVRTLADGFDRLERGDYRPILPIPTVELERIGQQFNHLAQSLHRVTSDNHLLIDKLLSVQEQERKELAAELHDEFGPALFGIRAEAACLMGSSASDPETRARARSIAELTDGIQKLNRRILDRLRPLILEQVGLSHALHEMLASWQARYPDIAWTLDITSDFSDPDESLSLMLYRIAQESVTNAIRHAQASAIAISLKRITSPRARLDVLMSVRDNGKGLPTDLSFGFGLLGMMERVRQFGGTLAIDNAEPTGVIVTVAAPEQKSPSSMHSIETKANPTRRPSPTTSGGYSFITSASC